VHYSTKCLYVLSNLIHTNTTPEHYIFILLLFPYNIFGHTFGTLSGRGYSCINGKAYCRRSLPFNINLIKYIKCSPLINNEKIKYSIKFVAKIQRIIKM
jgi:hypothetical protein